MHRLLAATAVLALLVACGDSIQFADPPKRESRAGTGLPAGHPTIGGSSNRTTTPATHGTSNDPFADPEDAGKPVTDGSDTAKVPDDKLWFKGRVELVPKDKKLPATYTIYVNAGPPPRGSPPMLSRRYMKPAFPFEFEIFESNKAFPGSKVQGEMVLSVIISEAGHVMAREGLYVKTVHPTPTKAESTDVVLELKL